MIRITDRISIDEKDLEFRFSRSSGKGGQNVNKVETCVEVRFDLSTESTLPEDVHNRLLKLAGRKVNGEGVLILTSEETRYQERNRELVLQKLMELVREASVRPKARRDTRPTRSSREKRLSGKKKESAKKEGRGKPKAE